MILSKKPAANRQYVDDQSEGDSLSGRRHEHPDEASKTEKTQAMTHGHTSFLSFVDCKTTPPRKRKKTRLQSQFVSDVEFLNFGF